MIVESGVGEIFCDGKTTKVGPGSVMFTTPNASHGIKNTGETPIVFYYVKWVGKESWKQQGETGSERGGRPPGLPDSRSAQRASGFDVLSMKGRPGGLPRTVESRD